MSSSTPVPFATRAPRLRAAARTLSLRSSFGNRESNRVSGANPRPCLAARSLREAEVNSRYERCCTRRVPPFPTPTLGVCQLSLPVSTALRGLFGRLSPQGIFLTQGTGIATQLLNISLASGLLVEIDPGEWPQIGEAEWTTQREGGVVESHVLVRRHNDGRVAIYLDANPGEGPFVKGDVLPAASTVEKTVQEFGRLHDLPDWVVDRCIQSIRG